MTNMLHRIHCLKSRTIQSESEAMASKKSLSLRGIGLGTVKDADPSSMDSWSSRETDGRWKMERRSDGLLDERPPRSTSGVELTGCSSARKLPSIRWCSKLWFGKGELSLRGRPSVLSFPLKTVDDNSLTSSATFNEFNHISVQISYDNYKECQLYNIL